MENLEKQTQNLQRYKIIANYFEEKGEDYDNTDRIYKNKDYLKNIKSICIDEAYRLLKNSEENIETKLELGKNFYKLGNRLEDLLEMGLIYHLKEIEGKRKIKRKGLFNLIKSNLINMTKIGVPH
jgi:hypothetical protein